MGETINNHPGKKQRNEKEFILILSKSIYDLIRLQTLSSLSHLSSLYPRSNLLSHFADWKEP